MRECQSNVMLEFLDHSSGGNICTMDFLFDLIQTFLHYLGLLKSYYEFMDMYFSILFSLYMMHIRALTASYLFK